jgi:hypothetical protein
MEIGIIEEDQINLLHGIRQRHQRYYHCLLQRRTTAVNVSADGIVEETVWVKEG